MCNDKGYELEEYCEFQDDDLKKKGIMAKIMTAWVVWHPVNGEG